MTTTQSGTTQTYTIDPSHTRLSFAVRHLMLTKVRGSFKNFEGTVTLGADGALAGISAKIDTNSIDTNQSDRDAHLKSPDFFDAATFPEMTFESTSVESTGTDTYTVRGNLTLHGVTKPVELKVEQEGKTVDPWGKNRIAYSATGRINRKDFGLVWNQALETGGVAVGEDVEISLDVQAAA